MTIDYFKRDAKLIVDGLFDNKLFIERLTRDELNGIEELIGYLMQSKFESHLRAHELFDKINKKP